VPLAIDFHDLFPGAVGIDGDFCGIAEVVAAGVYNPDDTLDRNEVRMEYATVKVSCPRCGKSLEIEYVLGRREMLRPPRIEVRCADCEAQLRAELPRAAMAYVVRRRDAPSIMRPLVERHPRNTI